MPRASRPSSVLASATVAVVLTACGYTQREKGGVVEVTVAPAGPAAWFEDETVAVRLTPGDHAQFWEAEQEGPASGYVQSKEAPAVFRGLDEGSTYTVRLPARFLYDPPEVTAGGDARSSLVVPVVVRTAILGPDPAFGNHKVLYVDTTARDDAYVLSWRDEGIKLTERRVSRDSSALLKALEEEHEIHGAHGARADRRFDQAVVVAWQDASLAELMPLLDTMGRFRREVEGADRVVMRPRFEVRVAAPEQLAIHAPEAAPSRASTYQGPEPIVTLSLPDWMQETQLAKTLSGAVPAIVDCYQHSLTTNPALEKAFTVVVDVDVDGRVPRAEVEKEEQLDRVAFCSSMAFRALQLEGIEHGHQLRIGIELSLPPGAQP